MSPPIDEAANNHLDPEAPPPAKPPLSTPSTPPPQRRRQPKAMRRLSLEIPEQLYRKMKVRAAITDTPMVDEVRALLEDYYTDDTGQGRR